MGIEISLKPVSVEDYEFLYTMLQERTPEQSISFIMPSWDNHIKFIENKPYEVWYIIMLDNRRIGNIYLARDNSWGYFITNPEQRKGYGTQAMQELARRHPRKYYIANINPDNTGAVHLARDRFKGELIKQVSYRIARENVLELG